MKKIILLSIIFIAFIAGIAFWALNSLPKQVKGAAPMGMRADSGSTSYITLASHTAVQIFATSTCVSRIIGTASTSLRMTLSDSATNPASGVGHVHSGSTTVMYDSGLYGCGLWRIYNPSDSAASTTITEFAGFR